MDKKQLEAKRQEASDQFDKLTKQKQEIESELVRLQGDFRTYTALIEELENDKPKVEVKEKK